MYMYRIAHPRKPGLWLERVTEGDFIWENLGWTENINNAKIMTEEDAGKIISSALKEKPFPAWMLKKERISHKVELPCNVGDTIYIPQQGRLDECKVESIYIDQRSTKLNTGSRLIDSELLGKTWFLSKEYAEASLPVGALTPSSTFKKKS